MENHTNIAEEIKKLYVHLLRLGLLGFVKSAEFDFFCEENGLDAIRNEIFCSLLTENKIPIPIKGYYANQQVIINFSNFPEDLVKPFFKDFLIKAYIQKTDRFVEIVVSFLTYYSRYNRNFTDFTPTPIDNDSMRTIGVDLLDLDYDEQDIEMYFSMAGYDLNNLLSMNDPKPATNLDDPNFITKENTNELYPIEIQESLKKFKSDFPDPKKVAFIMMQFGVTKEHTDIIISLRKNLTENGLSGVRADDKTYHDDKLYNILTYLHGCGFGIAVFETITDQSFNPNVSLEAGYLMGLHKPICLLKEKSLKTLPSDLVGRLYQEFSIEQCDLSISNVLRNWLSDKDLPGN